MPLLMATVYTARSYHALLDGGFPDVGPSGMVLKDQENLLACRIDVLVELLELDDSGAITAGALMKSGCLNRLTFGVNCQNSHMGHRIPGWNHCLEIQLTKLMAHKAHAGGFVDHVMIGEYMN